ncbi:OmpH family outer membrane protein [Candidatus Babeliales bacterium]|nr:OmpH family outer membrane protein [Candidatus Babeliales bacterium]MCF7899390.1 OmpH family outer membrane protein [Candidatus Babeliales bacterium]
MKKVLLFVASGVIFSSNFLNAEDNSSKISGLVSIDSIGLMQKSKEGQKLAVVMQSKIEEFQKTVQNKQKELVNFQEEVLKQEKVLSQEALEEKGRKLVQMKKDAERFLSDKEQAIKEELEKHQILLRNKQMKIFDDFCKKEKYSVALDARMPGVLFVSNSVDITDKALKEVDKKYDDEVVKNLVAKNDSSKKAESNTKKSA